MEIWEIVITPTLMNTKTALHIDKIEELLFGQWTFASDNVLVGTLGHRLCKRPLTSGYHFTQTVYVWLNHYRMARFFPSTLSITVGRYSAKSFSSF